MEDVAILNDIFTRPADFKIQFDDEAQRPIIVRALFDSEIASRVSEVPSGYQVAQEELSEGLLVTLTIRQDEDILNWLLSWGSHVRVLEPATLRQKLASEAQKMLENHRK
jgi:predicted DNA-binding transcriptional regulator YafY